MIETYPRSPRRRYDPADSPIIRSIVRSLGENYEPHEPSELLATDEAKGWDRLSAEAARQLSSKHSRELRSGVAPITDTAVQPWLPIVASQIEITPVKQ